MQSNSIYRLDMTQKGYINHHKIQFIIKIDHIK